MNPCLVIPFYEHAGKIESVIESLAPCGLPLVLVDDGSGPEASALLDAIAAKHPWVEVLHHPMNRGKGFALRLAYQRAAARGFSHVVQLDADAQHDAQDVGAFLAAMKDHPDALVLGEPRFGDDAPLVRLWARKLSVGLVWLATLSRAVRDPLCGFRGVPLAPTLRLMRRGRLGTHMDFDPELAVRLVWDGVPVVGVPTRVRYWPDGVSHFDVLWDDLRLAWLYVRLVLGMLVRAPRMLRERRAAT